MRIRFGTILAVVALSAGTAVAEDFARWVDPFVGTVGDGNCFPGPCRPFGLVQPSPDTGTKVTCGGYKFTDATIRGFSQTHLNGTGTHTGRTATSPISPENSMSICRKDRACRRRLNWPTTGGALPISLAQHLVGRIPQARRWARICF